MAYSSMLYLSSVGPIFLIVLQNAVAVLSFGDVHLKAGSLTSNPAAMSGFTALAADMNHRRDIDWMETERDGFASDS